MIPAEAVEAAAKATFEAQPQGVPRLPWEDLGEIMKAEYREHVIPALEAAAPHIQESMETE